MGSCLSGTKQRMESQQSQVKLCLGCLMWAKPWSAASPSWPRKLWRAPGISSPPRDWSKRSKPNRVMTPQQCRTWPSHRWIPSLLMLQRTTPMTEPIQRRTIKDQQPKKHSMSLCQVPLCLVFWSFNGVRAQCPSVCVCVCFMSVVPVCLCSSVNVCVNVVCVCVCVSVLNKTSGVRHRR